jgi:O-antigen/teichoic acid export membrane protein
MVVLLAKIGTPLMVGQFALAIAIAGPIFQFSNLGLRAAQVTDATREYTFGDYLGLRIAATGIGVIVLGCIATRHSFPLAGVIVTVGLAKAIEAISNLLAGFLQQHEHLDWVAISLMTKGALSVVAFGGGVLITKTVLGGTVGLLFGFLGSLAFQDIRFCRQLIGTPRSPLLPRWSGATLKLIWLTLPLGVVAMLVSLNTNIPRFAVAAQLGQSQLGIFAAMAYLIVPGVTIANALAESAAVRLAEDFAEGRRGRFVRLLLRLGCLVALLGMCGVAISLAGSHTILSVMYRAEYAEHADVLVWLMVAATFSYVGAIAGTGLTAARIFSLQAPLFLGMVVVTASTSALLIPRYGLLGAAWSLCLSTAAQTAGAAFLLARALRRP